MSDANRTSSSDDPIARAASESAPPEPGDVAPTGAVPAPTDRDASSPAKVAERVRLGPRDFLVPLILPVVIGLVVIVLAIVIGRAFKVPDNGIVFIVVLVIVAALAVAVAQFRERYAYKKATQMVMGNGATIGEADFPRERSPVMAYLLWFAFNLLCLHRYYLSRYVSGVIYTLTFGVFFIGWLVDGFMIPKMTRQRNRELWIQWFNRHGSDWVESTGTARDVRLNSFAAGEYPGAIRSKQILNFRVEQLNERGDMVGMTSVELVGAVIVGSLRDGDEVRVRGKTSRENILRTMSLENVTTQGRVTMRF